MQLKFRPSYRWVICILPNLLRVILEIQTFLQKILQTADVMSNY